MATASRILLLLAVCLAAGAAVDGLRLPPDASFPAGQAERLIRALNLLPKVSGRNAGAGGVDVAPGQLLERRVTLPGLPEGVADLGHHAGYYRLPNTHDARMFYFFFESRGKKEDPVVIWLTGGPGCSSELAVFYENGPFTIANNMSLVLNKYGWDKLDSSDVGSDDEHRHTKGRQVLRRLETGKYDSYFANEVYRCPFCKRRLASIDFNCLVSHAEGISSGIPRVGKTVNVHAFSAKHQALGIHLRNIQRVAIAGGRMAPIKPKVPKIKGQGSNKWMKRQMA